MPANVLIIDDSAIARAQLRRVLAAAGMNVFEQASAIGATRSIRNNSIDIVLVDVSMPGLSGDKLVGVLRHNPRLKRLIIVVVSALDEGELEILVGPNGANAVVSKDNVEHELVHVLTRIWTRTHRGSGEHILRARHSGMRSILEGERRATTQAVAASSDAGNSRPIDRDSFGTHSSGEHRILDVEAKRCAR